MADEPYGIDGRDIDRLDAAEFARLVNALLSAECAAQGLPVDALSISTRINDVDGGIDASFRGSIGTRYVEAGESAWQFKLTPQGQDETKKEATKPGPREVLDAGGHYYLAIAQDFTDRVKRTRIKWLKDVIANPDRVHVLNGSNIAEWASHYPAVLAALGIGPNLRKLRSYTRWADSEEHKPAYVPGEAQRQLQDVLTRSLHDPRGEHLRIEAPGGTGKTRTVLETLADPSFAPLVVYSQREEDFDVHVLDDIADRQAPAIIVIDDCNGVRHRQLTDRLPRGHRVRIITIGDEPRIPGLTPPYAYYELDGMKPEELRALLHKNYSPAISNRHISMVAEYSGGSARLALRLASRVLDLDETELANITTKDDIFRVLNMTVPAGIPFLVASLLALLRRVGWEADLAQDGQALVEFSGTSEATFKDAVADLTANGLITRQGRYRLVTPNPLAIYLAAQVWKERAWEIMERLFPSLSASGQESLLARAAELGQYEPASSALALILSPQGPFASIAQIEATGSGRVLRYLSVTNPEDTVAAIEQIVSADHDELRAAVHSRRDLMWALEKCVWNSALFTRAAAILLRLARAENEQYANNATGTWASLFNARLPATSAKPDTRLRYLRNLARETHDRDTQLLIASAADHGLAFFEMHTVSGEQQYGHIPEAQGGVTTIGEDIEYRLGMFEILRHLADTSDDPVIQEHVSKTILAIARPYFGSYLEALVIDQLEWLAARDPESVRFASHDWLQFKSTDGTTEEGSRRIEQLLSRIQPTDAWTRLLDLARRSPWSIQTPGMDDADVIGLFIGPLRECRAERSLDDIVAELTQHDLPSIAYVGASIAATADSAQGDWLTLLQSTTNAAPDLQRGYLLQLDRDDTSHRLRDTALALALERRTIPLQEAAQLWLALDVSAAGYDALASALAAGELAPDSIARSLGATRWPVQLETSRFLKLHDAVATALSAPDDGAPLLHMIMNHLRTHADALDRLRDRLEAAVLAFPIEGNAGVASKYEWAEACRLLLPQSAVSIASRILRPAAEGSLHLSQVDEEARVLNACLKAEPAPVWQAFADAGAKGWQLTLGANFWLELTPIEDEVITWIESGASRKVERARFAASVAPVESAPTKLAVYLLNNIDDDRVRESIAGAFMSGFYMGEESVRIRSQLTQLEAWKQQGLGAQRWATRVGTSLKARLQIAIRAEAEEAD